MNFPGVSLEVRTAQWGARDSLFVEIGEVDRAIGMFKFPDDIALGDSVNSGNSG